MRTFAYCALLPTLTNCDCTKPLNVFWLSMLFSGIMIVRLMTLLRHMFVTYHIACTHTHTHTHTYTHTNLVILILHLKFPMDK